MLSICTIFKKVKCVQMENKMADLIHNALPTPRRKIICIHPEDSVKMY